LSLVSRNNTFFGVSATATKGLGEMSPECCKHGYTEFLQHEHSSILKIVVRLYHTPEIVEIDGRRLVEMR
jgi:hypothetical protein